MSVLDPDEIVIIGDNTLYVSEVMMGRLRERSHEAEIIGRGVKVAVLPHEELLALRDCAPEVTVETATAEKCERIDRIMDGWGKLHKLGLRPLQPPTYAPSPKRTGTRERERRARQEARRQAKIANASP